MFKDLFTTIPGNNVKLFSVPIASHMERIETEENTAYGTNLKLDGLHTSENIFADNMHRVDDYNDTYLPTYVQATSSTGEVVYEEIDESAITGFTVSTNVAYSTPHKPK